MELGWHEWPLMLFTVLGQCAVGGFVVLALALLCGKTDDAQRKAIHKGMFFIWVLMAISFLASMMHLGTISRAFNSLNRIGSSGLSNEIAFGSLFFAIGGLYWLMAILNKMSPTAGKAWLVVAMIAGLAFVYGMGQVYQIETVPTWNNGYTSANFFLTMLIAGPLFGFLLNRRDCVCNGKILAVISVIALIISACLGLMQGSELAATHSSTVSASALVPQYGQLLALRLILVALGLGLWITSMLKAQTTAIPVLIFALALVICGEIVGRAVFYNLHMTVGVTFGG